MKGTHIAAVCRNFELYKFTDTIRSCNELIYFLY